MRYMCVYNLLIFLGCLVLHVRCQTICQKDQYTVVSSDGSFVRCLNCLTCHAGRGLYPPCGSRIQNPPNPDCRACPVGEFSGELDSSPCHSCQKCAEHEIITAPCTNQSNRICNGTCETGYFYSKEDSTHSCQKCAYCCFDGYDEPISECANQGLNTSKQHCRSRPDKDCSPGSRLPSATDCSGGTEASENGGLSNATIWVIVIGVVSTVIIALAIALVYLYRTRKKQEARTGTTAESYAQTGPVTEPTVQYNPSDTLSHAVMPAESHRGLGSVTVERQGSVNSGADLNQKSASEQAKQNTSHSSLPSGNSGVSFVAAVNLDAAKEDTDDRIPGVAVERQGGANSGGDLNQKTASERAKQNTSHSSLPSGNSGESFGAAVNLDAAKEDTDDRIPGVLSVPPTDAASPAGTVPVNDEDAPSDLKDTNSASSKCKVSRQCSRDSQRSGSSADPEAGKWKRSPSTSSFTEMLKSRRRSSSKRDEPLVDNEEQDTDGSQAPITIMKELLPQEVKEGSKVELAFKCKARGNSKLTHQWYKDGIPLQGKNEGTLVHKSVTLRDFGWYKCVASCEDSSSDSVESSLVELNVTPRDGTTYKCLKKIDFNTRDRIEDLLTQESYSLGGWRQVAFKYGMDHLKIKSLENDREAGKKTLDYLQSSNPDLTVYDFCKTLKEYEIRRLDIVKELLNHLSVPSSSNVYA